MTTLMAESKEELKSLLMRVKEESEKADLELSIQKCKIMVSGPITSQLMLLCPWDSPGKNTGVGCPPPRDLPNPGIKPLLLGLLHWQAGSLPLAPPGKPS